MTGDNPFVPREQSVRIGKFLLALSFCLPYLTLLPSDEHAMGWIDWMIYAPIWVLQGRGEILAGGPHPFALLMVQFWFPYTLIGIQAYRYANGRLSSERSYFLNVLILTVFAILIALPLSMIPSGFDGEVNIYSLYIPVPIISILALMSYNLLRPLKVETPWDQQSEVDETKTKDELVWND